MLLQNRHRTHLAVIALSLGGLLFIAAGLALTVEPQPVRAQAVEDADYVGVRECASCHRGLNSDHGDTRHALTLQDASRNSDVILADFSQGEALRTVQFPGEDAPRAFSADDVAFAVGSGRQVQRYLYEVDRNVYAVFPAEWNVTEQTWQPYTRAEQWPNPAYDWNQNCAGCHTTGLNPERGRWEDDGVQCESCHGPGSVHAEAADDASNEPDADELQEIRESIIVSPDAQVCGQCHSQGVASGENRPYAVGYLPGENLLDEFTLVAPDDSAHWRPSGHAASMNMQFNEWLASGHANALISVRGSDYAEDSCLQCHSADFQWTERLRAAHEAGERLGDAPDAVTLGEAQFGVTCASCHEMHGEGEYDYQLVNEPYALCASCHGDSDRIEQVHHPVLEMFEGLPVVENIATTPSQHFTNGVSCSTCHMPPTLQSGNTWYSGSHTMIPVYPAQVVEDQPDSCTSCHTDLSPDYMQQFVEETQAGILDRLTNMQVTLGTAGADAPQWVLAAYEFVANDGSLGVHNYAYASALLDAAALELGVAQQSLPQGITVRAMEDPTECASCHSDEHALWQSSPHANASLSATFQQRFAESGQPSYCMTCHASGYDPRTEEYVFEGVICSNCHFTTSDAPHPPGPVEVASDSAVCGQCHSGEHAPSYNEWLVSSHSDAGIDCADCHTAHDNGLRQVNVNTTCGSCHQEALVDEIHMGEDMSCVDCHMEQRATEDGVEVTTISHTLTIDPAVCADCHGNTHLLSFGDTMLSEQELSQLETLQEHVTQLEDTAVQNLNTGIVGGAIGALVLVAILFLVLRVGRRR